MVEDGLAGSPPRVQRDRPPSQHGFLRADGELLAIVCCLCHQVRRGNGCAATNRDRRRLAGADQGLVGAAAGRPRIGLRQARRHRDPDGRWPRVPLLAPRRQAARLVAIRGHGAPQGVGQHRRHIRRLSCGTKDQS